MLLDKKQKILLISFAAIILVTIILLYWNYGGKTTTTSIKPLEQPSQPVDFSIFQDPAFKALDNQSQGPVDIGQIGRENPFEPY